MLITRTSEYSGIERTKDIPCTQEQYDEYINGKHIQLAMPNISMEDREFIMTGLTTEEWDELFPEENDDYYQEPDPSDLPYCGAF